MLKKLHVCFEETTASAKPIPCMNGEPARFSGYNIIPKINTTFQHSIKVFNILEINKLILHVLSFWLASFHLQGIFYKQVFMSLSF